MITRAVPRFSPLVGRQLRATSSARPLSRLAALANTHLLPSSPTPSRLTAAALPSGVRFAHKIPRPPPPSASSVGSNPAAQPDSAPTGGESPRPDFRNAYYQLSFTCVPCGHRSHHNISKQGYHGGSVLIACPECRNRHVIADHLGIFGDRKMTVEDLVREKGQLVKRGSLGEDGDVEFWVDDQADGQGEGQSGAEKP